MQGRFAKILFSVEPLSSWISVLSVQECHFIVLSLPRLGENKKRTEVSLAKGNLGKHY